MTDPVSTEKSAARNARRQSLSTRIEKLLGLNEQSFLGVPEIMALAASLVMLLSVLFAYYYSLVPARARLEDLQRKRTQLQTRLRDSQEGVKRNTNTQTSVAEIGDSLQNFEANYLANRTQGRTALIDQLNSLIRRNSVRVSTGFSFAALDALDAGNQTNSATKSGLKGQTSFPGIAISMTVEGQYANLRRLLRDIEASNQFIVINAVELQSVTDVAASRAAAVAAMPNGTATGGAPPVSPRATYVSLRLDVAAYFRREAAASIDNGDTGSTKTTSTTTSLTTR